MSLRVAIHQPNYLPWLGYFAKAVYADVFIMLDDVQYPKNSFTNRVRIRGADGGRWMTVPVSVSLGQRINEVRAARPGWPSAHADLLRNTYKNMAHYHEVFEPLRAALAALDPGAALAETNETLIRWLLEHLDIEVRILRSSTLSVDAASDERLVGLVSAVAPGATYVSGRGAVKYQDPDRFARAGLGFEYLPFTHPDYAGAPAGLSVLDAAFHAGFAGTRELLRAAVGESDVR